ncbi:MAG TPA: hypothetical protein VGK20_04145 [Candidatus Binatia bacterium]|jgi:hypothetical protein
MANTSRSRPRSILLGSAILAAASGCGGGGGGGGLPATNLAFSVNWEQKAAVSASSEQAGAPGTESQFATPIPLSVNAIRFIVTPSTGTQCCIAVLRDSQAFIDRHILLTGIADGQAELEVNGFPTDFAPARGVAATCATLPPGQGSPCSGPQNTLPSFGSDAIPVDVVPGQQNVVNVDVHSLPFLLDLNPPDAGTADGVRPHVRFTVVDAVHDVNADSIDVQLSDPPVTAAADILSALHCADNDPQLPECSSGGALDVRGLKILSQSPSDLPPGTANLTIRATNTGSPTQSMESDTTFTVPGGETTTTTATSTTSTSSTTTSTGETTTTTLLPPQTFCLKYSVSNAVDLVGISWTTSYGTTGGDFIGTGENVACTKLLSTNPDETLATFNDDDANDELHAAIVSAQTFSGPVDLALCRFQQSPPLVLANLIVQVTEATAPDLSAADATVVIEEIQCPAQ